MNSVETIPRFESKFDQDRVDNEPLPSSPHATNELRTTHSAPIKSIPRESILVRATTSFLTSTIDKGLIDMWVDDGTNGNIDDNVRLIRFSTAASTIDGLFHSPKRSLQKSNRFEVDKSACKSLSPENNTHLYAQASGKPFVTFDASKIKVEKPYYTEHNSKSKQKGSESAAGVNISREGAESIVKPQITILETEPITPPRAERNGLGVIGSLDTPSLAKATSQEQAHQNPVDPTDGEVGMEHPKESASSIRRRLSNFVIVKDKTTERSTSEGRLLFKNHFKRRSVKAFNGQSVVADVGKLQRHGEKEGDCRDARPAKRSKSDILSNNAYEGRSPMILNFLKRRAIDERAVPIDTESGSEQNDDCSNERNEPPTNRSSRKLAMLMKKLSSRPAEEMASNSRPAKLPQSAATRLTTPAKRRSYSKMPHASESPVSERNHERSFSHQLASSGGTMNRTPEPMRKSDSIGQTPVTKRNRESIRKLLEGFSSRSKGNTFESNAVGAEEMGCEKARRGSFFARLFKRKSTESEQQLSETKNASCLKEGDAGDTPATPTPTESQTRWRQLSQKVARFLGMLVH